MNRHDRIAVLALVLTPLLALGGCADINWERSAYEGARQGAGNAARQPEGRAIPQTTPLPSYDQYERERQRLRTPTADASGDASGAAASAASR